MRPPGSWLLVLLVLAAGLVLLVRLGGRPAPTGSPQTAPHGPSPDEEAVLARMHRVLPRDAILPIYDPRFLPASQAGLRDDELVLGVAWGGAAKAYPISVLNTREMVNDELRGIPILVTW